MARIHAVLLLLLTAFISLAFASSAPTFCKCTCFKNSTIISLGPQKQTPDNKAQSPSGLSSRSASSSCLQCTKAFCLDHHISFCHDATEEDVQTLCFQRDSYKDRIIVWGFILGVAGMLSRAAWHRVMEWRERRRTSASGLPDASRGQYAPLAGPGETSNL